MSSEEEPIIPCVWITKYALTQGIFTIKNARDCGDGVVGDPTSLAYYHVEGRDWHRSESAAIARAEKMRRDKIASLTKSIAELKAMVFEVTRGDEP